MKARYFTEQDYAKISSWFIDWGWDAIPLAFLSSCGVVVSNEGVDICAGWVYSTDSAACWGENYISDKNTPKELRVGAIEFLIDRMAEEAKSKGFLVMMSSVKHRGLIKKLLSCGFEADYEQDMCNLTRIL